MEKEKNYGAALADELRVKLQNTDGYISPRDRFILDRGWGYETKEALDAAFDRYRRAHMCCVLLTREEFIAEAGPNYAETSGEAYDRLLEIYRKHKGIIGAFRIYDYARYHWCLRHPEAIIAQKVGDDTWLLNNCDTEISEDEAKRRIASEFGFQKARIKICGTPYYESTDWQFVQFSCGGYLWLWTQDMLFQTGCETPANKK